MELIKFFIGLILIIILSLFALPLFAKTVYEYDKYGKKTGYYVQNGNITTYYDKYGSKQYQYKNGKVYDKYGKFVKQYR
jgi:hypothetical protein